jgi:hypothetical protein
MRVFPKKSRTSLNLTAQRRSENALVSAQQARTEFTVSPLQLFFKEKADRERPDDEAHNTKPRTD